MNTYPYGIAAYPINSTVEEISKINGLSNSGSLRELNKINGLQSCKNTSLRQLSNFKSLVNCTLQQISNISHLWFTPKSAKTLDSNHGNWHDESVAAKSANGFSSLKPNGRHAANTSRFFCVCNLPLQLFLWAAGGGRLYACWLRLASLLTRLLSPTLAFSSARRALDPNGKVQP